MNNQLPPYEKLSAKILVLCKPSERAWWRKVLGDGVLARTIRELLNDECFAIEAEQVARANRRKAKAAERAGKRTK